MMKEFGMDRWPKPRRSMLYALSVLALSVATLEIGTRLVGSPRDEGSVYRQNSEGFEQWNQLTRDLPSCGSSGTRYYEYFLFSGQPCATATVNISAFFSSRRTPASKPAAAADLIVWVFGGSTMQELQTTDDWSIANAIARTMAAAGTRARVENFGAPTFQSSLELVKFMTLAARMAADRLPHVVVFYDGYNDANHGYYFGAGNMQNDLSSKLAALIEQKSGTLVLYGASIGLADVSEFWETHVHPRLEHALFRDPDPQADRANLRRAVDIYLRNMRMADGICGAIEARCFFVLQPLIATKNPLGANERQVLARMKPSLIEFTRGFYRLIRGQLQDSPAFIDASAVLNGDPGDVFHDLGHVSAFGVPAVGEFIGAKILARLAEASSAGLVHRELNH